MAQVPIEVLVGKERSIVDRGPLFLSSVPFRSLSTLLSLLVVLLKTGRRSKPSGKHHKGNLSARSPATPSAVEPKSSVGSLGGGGAGQQASPRNSPAAASQAPPLPGVDSAVRPNAVGSCAGLPGEVQGVRLQGVKRVRGDRGELGSTSGATKLSTELGETGFPGDKLKYQEIVVISRNPAPLGPQELPTPKGPPRTLKP